MSAIFQNKAVCVVVSVWNVCTMARNSMAEMVMEASDVEGASDETTGVVGGAIKVASSIGAAGAGGTDSVGSSSCCAFSACGGIGGTSLGGALRGAE